MKRLAELLRRAADALDPPARDFGELARRMPAGYKPARAPAYADVVEEIHRERERETRLPRASAESRRIEADAARARAAAFPAGVLGEVEVIDLDKFRPPK